MKLSESVKPLSYLKANTARIIQDVDEQDKAFIITKDGEAKAVIQSLKSYEDDQETMTLLKILALGRKSIDEGRTRPSNEVFADLRAEFS